MNVRSTILGTALLVVLLTAGAAQSLSGANTVFSDDIVDGQVAYADIRNDAMTGAKILNNSVTGADVNEATLNLTCPTGMTRFGDVCATPRRPSADLFAAGFDCEEDRLRLPSFTEAGVIERFSGGIQIWTDIRYIDDGVIKGVANGGANGGSTLAANPAAVVPYRCVTTVGARP